MYIYTWLNHCFNCFTDPTALKGSIEKRILESEIIVKWDPVDNSLPTNYTVTWTSDGTNSTQSHTLANQSSCTITGLTLDTVYNITITATNRCGTRPEYQTSVSFSAGTYQFH